MKKREILNIGEDFYYKGNINDVYYNQYKTLYECYNNWSYRKHEVFEYYKELLNDNCDDVLKYGIRSYNSMIIVLHSIVIKDGKKYYLLITPSHNWYNEINED